MRLILTCVALTGAPCLALAQVALDKPIPSLPGLLILLTERTACRLSLNQRVLKKKVELT
jgi:hypothetical protein